MQEYIMPQKLASITESNTPSFVKGVRLHHDWARRRQVLLAPERVVAIDRTAFDILSRCDGRRTVASIADELANHYAGDRAVILSDVQAVLQGLFEKRFMVLTGSGLEEPQTAPTQHPVAGAKTHHTADLPLAALAELTHRCPLQCPYCSNPIDLERNELTTDEWRRVIDEVASLGVLQIHFSGGEPLARKDLASLVKHAAASGLYTNLITSGVLLNRERLKMLEAGLDHVQISLQDVHPDRADEIANYPSAHQKKLAAARLVREAGIPLTVNAVVHRQNLHRLTDLIELAVALDAARLEVAHVQYQGWALKNRAALIPTEAQFDEATKVVEEARDRLKGVLVIDYVIPDYYAVRPKNCMGGWGRHFLNVTPSGLVLPCHAAESIPGLTFKSVRDHSLAWIWQNSPAMRKFRGFGWMKEPCKSCEFRGVDHGGCRCQALALTGDATNADPACEKSPFHSLTRDLARQEAAADSTQFSHRGFLRSE